MEWTTYVASLLFIALQPLALHQSDNGELEARQLAEMTVVRAAQLRQRAAVVHRSCTCCGSVGPASYFTLSLSGAAGHCMRQCVVQPLLAVAAMDGLMDDGDRWVESYHTRERIQR